MNIPLVDLKRQYKQIRHKVNPAVLTVLKEANFILGSQVDIFEKEFASFCGSSYCVGVASGSDAIFLSLKALNIQKNDAVITVANTFISTVFPILMLGALPVLVDINPATYQIDVGLLEKAITKKTKAILAVHLYGIPAPMVEIMKLAKKYGLKVVEDACQAHGSSINGKKCGSFGDLAAFSFYPGKNLGGAGDGGAVITSNKALFEKIKVMRNIGQVQKYRHEIFGLNSRLDTLQAAYLSVKLKFLKDWNETRVKLAGYYDKNLSNLPIKLPPKPTKASLSNFHLYVIRTDKRDSLLEFLKKHGVFAGIHYPIPLHLQKSLASLGYKKGDFPITEEYSSQILSLPMFPELRVREIEFISKLIRQFFKIK